MNPLSDMPGVRRVLYIIQWVINGILVIAGAVFLAQGTDLEDLPEWYVLALAIGPVLWTYLGIQAQTNTPVEPTPLPPTTTTTR